VSTRLFGATLQNGQANALAAEHTSLRLRDTTTTATATAKGATTSITTPTPTTPAPITIPITTTTNTTNSTTTTAATTTNTTTTTTTTAAATTATTTTTRILLLILGFTLYLPTGLFGATLQDGQVDALATKQIALRLRDTTATDSATAAAGQPLTLTLNP